MARINVNNLCNVLTGEDSHAYRAHLQPVAPQITVPSLRIRLYIREAEELVAALMEAVARAKQEVK